MFICFINNLHSIYIVNVEMLSEYASDIFTGLISSATHTNERIRAMGGRVDNVLGHLNYLEELSTEQCDKKDIQPLLEKDTPLSAPMYIL